DGEDRHEVEERLRPFARELTAHVGDHDRTADVARGVTARDHAAQEIQREAGDLDRAPRAGRNRAERAMADARQVRIARNRDRAADAESSDDEPVLELTRFGRDDQRLAGAIALDDERYGHAVVVLDDVDELLPRRDRTAGRLHDAIAFLESARRARSVVVHR